MFRKILFGSMFAMAMSGAALAQGPYVGAKIASLNPDDHDGASLDSAVNAGIVLGYEIVPDYGLGVEAEFTTSVSDGDFSYLGQSGNWDVDTSAIYAVSRMGDQFYLKVKAGYIHESGSISALGQSFSASDSGFSWGLGGGYKFTQNISAEVEWTKVDSDIDAWSAGLNYSF